MNAVPARTVSTKATFTASASGPGRSPMNVSMATSRVSCFNRFATRTSPDGQPETARAMVGCMLWK
jgi:hypothetical protein